MARQRSSKRRIGSGFEPLEARWTPASVLPDGFVDLRIASGITAPTAMAVAPDGRIFVNSQNGDVHVIKNGVKLSTPFLDLAVNSQGERGLLGIAIDPNFASNNFVYVYYTTASSPIHNRVSRFTAQGDVAAPGSERVLLDLENLSSAQNHNGGAIHFGIDGKLYVAVGENANRDNSQDLGNRLGKMLRINKDGSIPADNPFVNVSGARDEIWALGLRNPFTFAVQPGTGRLYINDVGGTKWEEINRGAAGANYGWPIEEGPDGGNANFVDPIFAYQHDAGVPQGRCISGGAFYNAANNQFPSTFVGDYFFSDFIAGFIWRYDVATDTAAPFGSGFNLPVDLQVRANGDLLYLSRGSGELRAIRYVNDPPTLEIGGNITYNGFAQLIAPQGVITDADSTNFRNGHLRALIQDGGQSSDRLLIRNAGSITTSNGNLFYQSQKIGTYTGGRGTTPLDITFTANVAPARAQEVLRNIYYRSISATPSSTTRLLRVGISDGDGAAAFDTKRIFMSGGPAAMSDSSLAEKKADDSTSINSASFTFDTSDPQSITTPILQDLLISKPGIAAKKGQSS